MELKHSSSLVAVAAIMLTMTGCGSYTPDAGHEVVLVEKPIIFGHGGVDPEPVKTGRTFAAWTTEGITVGSQ